VHFFDAEANRDKIRGGTAMQKAMMDGILPAAVMFLENGGVVLDSAYEGSVFRYYFCRAVFP
jgi:hypothetical protein